MPARKKSRTSKHDEAREHFTPGQKEYFRICAKYGKRMEPFMGRALDARETAQFARIEAERNREEAGWRKVYCRDERSDTPVKLREWIERELTRKLDAVERARTVSPRPELCEADAAIETRVCKAARKRAKDAELRLPCEAEARTLGEIIAWCRREEAKSGETVTPTGEEAKAEAAPKPGAATAGGAKKTPPRVSRKLVDGLEAFLKKHPKRTFRYKDLKDLMREERFITKDYTPQAVSAAKSVLRKRDRKFTKRGYCYAP